VFCRVQNIRFNIKQHTPGVDLCYFPRPVVSLIAITIPALVGGLLADEFGTAKTAALLLVTNVPATTFAITERGGFHIISISGEKREICHARKWLQFLLYGSVKS
jgi:hypothetical protein